MRVWHPRRRVVPRLRPDFVAIASLPSSVVPHPYSIFVSFAHGSSLSRIGRNDHHSRHPSTTSAAASSSRRRCMLIWIYDASDSRRHQFLSRSFSLSASTVRSRRHRYFADAAELLLPSSLLSISSSSSVLTVRSLFLVSAEMSPPSPFFDDQRRRLPTYTTAPKPSASSGQRRLSPISFSSTSHLSLSLSLSHK